MFSIFSPLPFSQAGVWEKQKAWGHAQLRLTQHTGLMWILSSTSRKPVGITDTPSALSTLW